MGITLISKPKVLTYNKGIVNARFIFTEQRDGVITALFKVDDVTYAMLLDNNGVCKIPEEMYTSKMYEFSVGLINESYSTDNVIIKYDRSCYVEETSISEPTEDIYNQIIRLINNIMSGASSSETAVVRPTSSSFDVSVNGGQQNWVSEDEETCYYPKQNNQFNEIPSKIRDLINASNTHDAAYYCTLVENGVQLDTDISTKAESIDFIALIFAQNQTWYNTSVRLIAHSPNVTESEYRKKYVAKNKDIVVLFTGDLHAGNAQRNITIKGIPLYTKLKRKSTGEEIDRGGWILRFQVITDNTQDYISDSSHVVITFNDK